MPGSDIEALSGYSLGELRAIDTSNWWQGIRLYFFLRVGAPVCDLVECMGVTRIEYNQPQPGGFGLRSDLFLLLQSVCRRRGGYVVKIESFSYEQSDPSESTLLIECRDIRFSPDCPAPALGIDPFVEEDHPGLKEGLEQFHESWSRHGRDIPVEYPGARTMKKILRETKAAIRKARS